MSKLEEEIVKLLSEEDIVFRREWSDVWSYYPSTGHKFRYDFYLPQYQTVLEVHGPQHYEETEWFTTPLGIIQERDMIKGFLAMKHNLQYIEIPYSSVSSLTAKKLKHRLEKLKLGQYSKI